MWSAEICRPHDAPDWLAISLEMDPLTLDIARAFCDSIYEMIKTKVLDKDLRDVDKLISLMTDLHAIVHEESERS